jgi:hypothetical protein
MVKKAPWAKEARALEEQGYSRVQIALKLRVSKALVTQVLGARIIDPSQASRVRIIEVPGWVPADMREEYLAVAHNETEFKAAEWARAEKRRRGL